MRKHGEKTKKQPNRQQYKTTSGQQGLWHHKLHLPSHFSLGKGSQGTPIRPIRDYEGLLGLLRACWEELAPRPEAPMAHKTMRFRARALQRGASHLRASCTCKEYVWALTESPYCVFGLQRTICLCICRYIHNAYVCRYNMCKTICV